MPLDKITTDVETEDVQPPGDDEIEDDAQHEEDVEDIAEVDEIEPCEPCQGSRIEIAKNGNDYHWMLYAKNGRMIATNPVPYRRLNDLKIAVESVREAVKDAMLVSIDLLFFGMT